jgi:hypothetical protein
MPFILNEDKALKAALSGITVSDSGNSARPVGVWFGQPDPEIRFQSYPYITIDLINVTIDSEREMRGEWYFTPGEHKYSPEGTVDGQEYRSSLPIPVYLDYQITTYARQPRHDRQIIYELTKQTRIPFRFGGLVIPEDRSIRRLDLIGFAKRDTTEQDKRLFRNVYTVRISSELFQKEFADVYKVTQNPNIDIQYTATPFETITL